VHEYDVWLPHARRVTVERLGGGPQILSVAETGLAEDSYSYTEQYPVAAGYSAAGEAPPPGLCELRACGGLREPPTYRLNIQGKIALIRYGNVFRGDKVRNAEQAGAVAVILYSDPEDDGYQRGAVYPDGPFRPPTGIQRGSIKVGAPGDPGSPGRPALVGSNYPAPTTGLPEIPVVALGYAAAAELLDELAGPTAPVAWQGGLPATYRYGGTGLPVRVRVEMEGNPWRRIRNVVGTIEGSVRPDEWVIVGAHYDSWTHGAIDNVSGTAAMLEAARLLGEQAAAGNRPDRSLLFAVWDAEEWGLIGSTEWVEEHARELRDGAVAYINLDGIPAAPTSRP